MMNKLLFTLEGELPSVGVIRTSQASAHEAQEAVRDAKQTSPSRTWRVTGIRTIINPNKLRFGDLSSPYFPDPEEGK